MEDTGTSIFIAHAQPVDSDSDSASDSFRKPILIANASEILPLYRQKRFWCAVALVLCAISLTAFLAVEFAAPKSKEATTPSNDLPLYLTVAPSDELSSNPTQLPYPSNDPSAAPSHVPSAPPTISDSPSSSPTLSPTSYEFAQMNALIALYEAAGGTSWYNTDSWGSFSVLVCAWHGVGCNNDGHIIKIDLSSNNLHGMSYK